MPSPQNMPSGEGIRIGIDLGGTKIEGIAIADDGSERLRRRIPAPRGDYANTLAAVAGLVRAIEHELAAEGTVGVGIPGTISQAAKPIPDFAARHPGYAAIFCNSTINVSGAVTFGE